MIKQQDVPLTPAPDQERSTEPMQVPPPGQQLQPDEPVASKQLEKGQNADNKPQPNLTAAALPDSKSSGAFVRVVTSPWLLMSVPLTVGGVWLATNPGIILNNLNRPYALLAGPTLVVSFLALWFVVKFFTLIAQWCRSAWSAFQRARKEDSSAQFFWIVIVVFIIVSVFASGSFFTKLEHNVLPGLGHATALFIDLVAVQAMRARLNAVRMNNRKLSNIYLLGVLLCAFASAFANVYTSLGDFDQHATGALPAWMVMVAPWFGLVFPALILLLSVTADYTIDQVSTKLNPEQYKEQQAKRTKLLEYQRDALQEQLRYEQEIEQITNQLYNRRPRRVFFLINWLFPVRTQSQVAQPVDTQALTKEIQTQIIEQLKPWFQILDGKYHRITTTSQQQFMSALQEYHNQMLQFFTDTERNAELLAGQVQNIHSNIELLQNSVSAKTSREQNSRRGKENPSISVKRETKKQEIGNGSVQISRKSLNFKPSALHQKAVEFLRNFANIESISGDIQRLGYEWLATQIRQEPDLNFAFVTPQFASETWALYQLEAEKQPDGDNDSPSPSDNKKEAILAPTESLVENKETEVNQQLEPNQSGESVVNLHENSSPDGEHSPGVKQATGEGNQTEKEQVAGEEPEEKGQSDTTKMSEETTDHLVVSEEQLEEKSEPERPPISGDNSEIIASQHESENEAVLPNISEILPEETELSQNITEPERSPEQISRASEHISSSETSVEEKYHDKSESQKKISEPGPTNKRPHGPHSLTIEDVAKQFDTTVPIIEQAIEKGVLLLSKRGTRKVLVSSLEGFSPPRKPGRRSTKGQNQSAAATTPSGKQQAKTRPTPKKTN